MVKHDCSLKEILRAFESASQSIHNLATEMEKNIMMRKANNRKAAHGFRPNYLKDKIPHNNMSNKVMQGRIHKHC